MADAAQRLVQRFHVVPEAWQSFVKDRAKYGEGVQGYTGYTAWALSAERSLNVQKKKRRPLEVSSCQDMLQQRALRVEEGVVESRKRHGMENGHAVYLLVCSETSCINEVPLDVDRESCTLVACNSHCKAKWPETGSERTTEV